MLGTALSRDVFLTFVGQPRTNRLLLIPVSDHGRPETVSKVGVSPEASQKMSKKRRAKTSPAFSLDVFRTFFRQPRANHLLLKLFLVKNRGPSRMGSRKIARLRPGCGSAQNFAAVLMEATVSFFGETGCCF